MGIRKFLVLILSYPILINAQILVKGKVLDSFQKPIPKVTILVKPLQKSNVVSYGFTNDSGVYSLKIPKIGNYIIFFNSTEYKKYNIDFTVIDSNEIKRIDVILERDITTLKAVEVTVENAIVKKGDTTIIQVKPFLQGNETVVEDILKKLPGINVDDNGRVTVNDVEVSKIMVEGDDFFERGYKLLTKNMQANAIKAAEIIDKYSPNKHLKGVEHSEKVVLNLKLKDAYKLYWFGNTNSGIDFTNLQYYDINATLQSYSKKNKYFFITNLNNIGGNHGSDISALTQNINEAPIFSNNNLTLDEIVRLAPPILSLGKLNSNFNNDKLLNLNAIFNPSKKIKIKTLLLTSFNESKYYNNNMYIYQFNNVSFINNESIKFNSMVNDFLGKIDFNIDLSSSASLQSFLQYRYGTKRDYNNTILNSIDNNQILNQTENYLNWNFTLTSKIKKNHVLIINGQYLYQTIPQYYFNDTFDLGNLFVFNPVNNTQQNSLQAFHYGKIESSFYIKTKKQNTQVIYTGIEFRKDLFENNFYLKYNDSVTNSPSNYKNLFDYTVFKLYAKTNYRIKIYKKLSWLIDAELNQYFNTFQQQVTPSRVTDNPTTLNLLNGLNYYFTENTKLIFNYYLTNNNNTVNDIVPNFYQTNYRSFLQGLGTLNQIQSNQFSMIFTAKNFGTRSFFLNLNYTQQPRYFSFNNQIYSNYFLSQKIILKNKSQFSFRTSFSQYSYLFKINFKINFSYDKIQNQDITESILRDVQTELFRYGIELRSSFKGFFNFNLGSIIQNNIITTKFINNNDFVSNFLDLIFKFKDHFFINITNDHYYFKNNNNKNLDYIFTNININYNFKKINIELKGKNIFNIDQINTTNNTDVSTLYANYAILPRIILLQVTYNF